ncbi:MAG: hypothetical protein FWC50_06940 [Planctomycetaceae bacterium]|nr:hypothetical protein [Planctomycetaceae bacterium]
MPRLTNSKLPKYYRLSGKNIGYFWKDGKKVYLPGKYGSPESKAAYDRAMASLLEERAIQVDGKDKITVTDQEKQSPKIDMEKITIVGMVAEFLEWGKGYYVKNGIPAGTLDDFVLASKPLVGKYGNTLVKKFVQMDLIRIQEHLVKSGISRDHINKRIGRIKRIFNWAAGRGLISFQTQIRS